MLGANSGAASTSGRSPRDRAPRLPPAARRRSLVARRAAARRARRPLRLRPGRPGADDRRGQLRAHDDAGRADADPPGPDRPARARAARRRARLHERAARRRPRGDRAGRDGALRGVVGAGHGLLRPPLRRLPRRALDLPHRGDHPGALPRQRRGRVGRAARAGRGRRVPDPLLPGGERLPARSPHPGRRHELELPALLPQPQHRRGRRHRHAHAGRAPDRAAHERATRRTSSCPSSPRERAARFPTYEAEERLEARAGRRSRAGAAARHALARAAAARASTPSPRCSASPMATPPPRGLEALREALRSRARAQRRAAPSTPAPSSSSRTAPCTRSASASARCSQPGDEVVVPAPMLLLRRADPRGRRRVPCTSSLPSRTAGAGMPSDRARDRPADARPPPLQPGQPDRPRSRRRRRSRPSSPSPSATGCSSSPTRRTRRALWEDASLASAFGLADGRGRDPQPRQEPRAAAAARRDRSPGLPPSSTACARTLEWDCLRVGRRLAGGGARRAHRPARLARTTVSRTMARAREPRSRSSRASTGFSRSLLAAGRSSSSAQKTAVPTSPTSCSRSAFPSSTGGTSRLRGTRGSRSAGRTRCGPRSSGHSRGGRPPGDENGPFGGLLICLRSSTESEPQRRSPRRPAGSRARDPSGTGIGWDGAPTRTIGASRSQKQCCAICAAISAPKPPNCTASWATTTRCVFATDCGDRVGVERHERPRIDDLDARPPQARARARPGARGAPSRRERRR